MDTVDRKEAESARLYYIAALISLLAKTFFTEDFEDALDKVKSHLQEEIILELCKILKTRKDILNDEFYELYDSLKKVAGDTKCPEEIVSVSALTKEELAARIIAEMNGLSEPLCIPEDTPGFDF